MKAMDTRLRARRARFGVPRKERSDRGKSRLPSKVNAIIETAIKKIYLTAEQPDVAAVIEEVQLKCFNAKTETSSAADPATDFRPFANSPRSLANNFRIDSSTNAEGKLTKRQSKSTSAQSTRFLAAVFSVGRFRALRPGNRLLFLRGSDCAAECFLNLSLIGTKPR